MKITVDMGVCDLHGECCIAAPTVFGLVGDDLVYEGEPDESLRPQVEEAIRSCPVQAISLTDD